MMGAVRALDAGRLKTHELIELIAGADLSALERAWDAAMASSADEKETATKLANESLEAQVNRQILDDLVKYLVRR